MLPFAQETVLVVCNDETTSHRLLGQLLDGGLSVIGPASSAASALALAAQTAPTVALVASEPTGRRKAVELAQDLMNTWGIPSVVTDEACPNSLTPTEGVYWAPLPAQRERLSLALGHAPA